MSTKINHTQVPLLPAASIDVPGCRSAGTVREDILGGFAAGLGLGLGCGSAARRAEKLWG